MSTNFTITTVDQVQTGTYGYLVKIDTTNIIAYDISFIQAYAVIAGVSSTPSGSSISVKTLAEYLERETSPDLAFNYTHGMLTIFLNTVAYPYTTDTEITIFGRRNAIKLAKDDDIADFPDELIELFSAYTIKFASLLKGKPIPADAVRIIMREEYAIKNAE